jgi:hypothetical protein
MIYKKLLEFQKLGISIKKDKRNPHYKNDYASLNEVLDKVKEELNKMNVVIIQKPCAGGLDTVLYDTEDDTKLDSFTPFINPTDMQKLGGAITYARRYALVSMLALEDEDDDGNTASHDKEKSVTPATAYKPVDQRPTVKDDLSFLN